MPRFAGLAGLASLLTPVVLAGLLAAPASADITRGVTGTANQRVAARTATGTPVTLTAGPEVTVYPSFTVLGTRTRCPNLVSTWPTGPLGRRSLASSSCP
jgi:hypothetical protein